MITLEDRLENVEMLLFKLMNEMLQDNPQLLSKMLEDHFEEQDDLDALLMEVVNKYPGETRYETAKRIIRENQNQDNGPAKEAYK